MLWLEMIHYLFEENLSRPIIKQGRVVFKVNSFKNVKYERIFFVKLVYAVYIEVSP